VIEDEQLCLACFSSAEAAGGARRLFKVRKELDMRFREEVRKREGERKGGK